MEVTGIFKAGPRLMDTFAAGVLDMGLCEGCGGHCSTAQQNGKGDWLGRGILARKGVIIVSNTLMLNFRVNVRKD